ncbi:alpha/beta hydrolase [Sporosarcina sp. PTS2304]|uniref:alpha/beta hydrolase n=1 Tax=Sporosarcina sp. PTS2304 TaxID=2283194 RepID=UPI000E0CD4CB|nr:alpha/beta hydrolase [Sporosarcina sp. PTS2304]AXI00628.1 alpha/beta hydrolase [Sporosarcina sp. PTS2304]
MKRKKSFRLKLLSSLAVAFLLAFAGFFAFVSSPYKAQSWAEENLQTDTQVLVDEDKKNILFEPATGATHIGFIFYQGGKVVPGAYAPLAKKLASNGYTVIIPKLPFNLAILSPDRADKVIRNHPEIDTWIIGGHSLGGVTASDYALRHEKIKGLVLLASYPQAETDLSEREIQTLSLYGGNDQVADLTKVKAAKTQLPSSARFIEIDGGNHGGFGDYGHQKGDGEATITNEQQIEETAKYIMELIEGL